MCANFQRTYFMIFIDESIAMLEYLDYHSWLLKLGLSIHEVKINRRWKTKICIIWKFVAMYVCMYIVLFYMLLLCLMVAIFFY